MAFGMRCLVTCLLLLLAGTRAAHAQLDDIRKENNLTADQKARIASWLTEKLKPVEQAKDSESVRAFLTAVEAEWVNSENSLAFLQGLADQSSKLARERFVKADLHHMVGFAVARALVDMDRPETIPAFLVGLESASESVRYLSAVGLVARMRDYAGDAKLRPEVVAAVKRAAPKETNGFVLQHMYRVISLPTPDPEAFNTFLAVFDARLARRRAGGLTVDVGEIEAFSYFKDPAIGGALNALQKNELVGRLAVFLRMNAERFAAPVLSAEESFAVGATLSANEEALRAVGITGGGNIVGVLAPGAGASVVAEAIRWVGEAKNQTKGILNDAPWNVPVGAP